VETMCGRSCREQTLPVRNVVLGFKSVLLIFLAFGLAFTSIGIGVTFGVNVNEIIIDYTDCKSNKDQARCVDIIRKILDGVPSSCTCDVEIPKEIMGEADWAGPVFIYYGLSNFFQNEKQYFYSRNDAQLYAKDGFTENLQMNCTPYNSPMAQNNNGSKPRLISYAPCGKVANSMFNDTISLQWKKKGIYLDIALARRGIAWASEKSRYSNPPVPAGQTLSKVFAASGILAPPNWQVAVWQLDTAHPENNGFQNEDLQVWMRNAATNDFRKLYRRVEHVEEAEGLPGLGHGLPGNQTYRLRIGYNYPVKSFRGPKTVILSQTSWQVNLTLTRDRKT